VPAADTADFYAVARALAVFNLLGSYARRRVVPRRWVLDYWHTRLCALRPGYDVVVSQRVGWSQEKAPWPDLLDLIDRAGRYKCRRACCTPATQTGENNPQPPVAVSAPGGEGVQAGTQGGRDAHPLTRRAADNLAAVRRALGEDPDQ
jgi:hypothetical protein